MLRRSRILGVFSVLGILSAVGCQPSVQPPPPPSTAAAPAPNESAASAVELQTDVKRESAGAVKKYRDRSELIAAVEPSVIRLDLVIKDGSAVGSGFIVSEDGMAVTNYHVMHGAQSATATFQNGGTAPVVGVYCMDKARDIAVIQVRAAGKLASLAVAESLPAKGAGVVALGSPKGLSFSVTEGIVSAVRKGSELDEYGAAASGTWVQTSAPISPGNSGGPLIDENGLVIGANTLALVNAQNINFTTSCIDIHELLVKAKQLEAKPLASSAGDAAKPAKKTTRREPATSLATDAREQAIQALEDSKRERSQAIAKKLEEVAEQKIVLKKAMLAGDEAEERLRRSEIRDRCREISRLAEENPAFIPLDLRNLRTGQTGILDRKVRVLQILDKESGECLVVIDRLSYRAKIFSLHGIDLTSTVDDDDLTLPPTLLLAVGGTVTYRTTGKGTHTVFALVAVSDAKDYSLTIPVIEREHSLSEDERRLVQQLADERAQRRLAEKQAAAEQDKKSDQEREQAKRQQAAKTKLETGKQLLKAGKSDAARKRFSEILEEYGDTAAAKEAREILLGR